MCLHPDLLHLRPPIFAPFPPSRLSTSAAPAVALTLRTLPPRRARMARPSLIHAYPSGDPSPPVLSPRPRPLIHRYSEIASDCC